MNGILNISIGKKKSNKYINLISITVTSFVTILMFIAIWYSHNIALIFITIYLWIIVIKQCQTNIQKQRIYEILEKNI